MATKGIFVHHDFQGSNQIKNVLIDVRSSDPGSPAEGQFWYNSTSHNLKYRDNGATQILGTSAGVSNAYSTVTDGTTPQASSGSDTLTVAATGTGLTVNTSTAKTLTYVLNSGLTGASKVLLLTAGGKITASVGQQVWATTDLTDVGSKTGSGTALVFGTGPTLSNPIITGGSSTVAGTLAYVTGALIYGDGSNARTLVTLDNTQTLTNKTLTTPTIGDFSNAGHNHTNAAGGGTLTHSAISDFDTQVRTSTLNQMTAPTADLSINSHKLTNVLDPTNPQDAATKNYVDINIQGLQPKPTAQAATTAALAANTYANGTAGVGATLTANANGALGTIDGVTLTAGQLLLVKNEATAANNGLYTVTQVGTGGTPYILTRHTDMDQTGEFSGAFIPVGSGGTTNGNSLWLANPSGTVTVGTTTIPFTQLNGATDLIAGNGVTISGNTISASLAARLAFNGATIDLQSGIATPGTYTSVTVDTYGRTTAGADIVTATGVVCKTASGAFTARTITGTASRLTVTNGDGVSGAPTLDISASYVGQTSITTLGTITSGTWTGTTIAIANGGTGQTSAANARGTSGLGSQTAPTVQTNVTLAAAGIPTMVKATLTGTGAATTFTVTHNLNNLQPLIQLLDSAGNLVDVGTQATDANNVVFTFNAAPANASTWLATVIG